jgi:hypothetical protein
MVRKIEEEKGDFVIVFNILFADTRSTQSRRWTS